MFEVVESSVEVEGFGTVEKLDSFPPNENPFNHDAFHMGTKMGKDLMIMHANHTNEKCNYMIFINTKTGERFRVKFSETFLKNKKEDSTFHKNL